MKIFLACFVLTVSLWSHGQNDSTLCLKETLSFQKDQDEHYLNKETSPLTKKERRKFKGHRFYTYDAEFCVQASFDRIENGDTVIMKTSANTEKVYIEYARVKFLIGADSCSMIVYQNVKLSQMNEYKDYLFLPFKDATSGTDSYGGGRYLDLHIPEGNTITLNFNLAYNPYCAYTAGYYCPIPPAENTLKVAIRAGVMAPESH